MIFLRLANGLGNQMFEYAYARYLQEKYKEVMWINIEDFKKDKQRDYSLAHFKLNPNVYVQQGIWSEISYKYIDYIMQKYKKLWSGCTERERNRKREELVKKYGIYAALPSACKYYHFPRTKRKNKLVIGSFQTEKYFNEIKEIIKREFELKEELPEKVVTVMHKMQKENSVCVHIRRGDYLKAQNRNFNICNENYYMRAMDVVADSVEDPKFYIFSNSKEDLQFIERNFRFKYPVEYVDMNNPDYLELKLMSACKHFVMSNSSFSWWAQYLSESPDKIVVAPDKWYTQNQKQDKDIYMDTWRVLEV